MKRLVFIAFLGLTSYSRAQVLSQSSMGVRAGFMDFSPKWIDNRTNSNNRKTAVSDLDFNFRLSKVFSFNTGFGIGNIQNMENTFKPYQTSEFYRLKAGVLLRLPYDNTIQPFVGVGYNFDCIVDNKQAGYGAVSSNMNFGGGLFFKLNNTLSLQYHYTVHQRVGQDYRTFVQHLFGLNVILERRAKTASQETPQL